MPTYEYECEACRESFEIFQNITEAPKDTCPKCNGRLTRLIGRGSGIIFKGAGFYANDYKKGKPSEETSCPLKKEDGSCNSCPSAK